MRPPLRIGVDARPLSAASTGIGRYLDALLGRLISRTGSTVRWYLYCDRPLVHKLRTGANVVIRDYPAPAGKPAMLWRTQIGFSCRAARDELDVFWSPRHHLPLLLSRRVRKLVTIHDLVWKYYPQMMRRSGLWLERVLMPLSVRLADHILTDSLSTRSDLTKAFAVAGKTSIVPCGCESWPPQAALVEPPYFLFVGTRQPRKNIGGILRALRLLLDEGCVAYRLVLAGGSGWHIDVEALMTDLKLNERVILLGEVTDAELHALYQHAFALLCPSFHEGFGLPALEAMQYGVPVIGSDCAALPEVIGDGGLLVNPHDPRAIKNAMHTLLTCPQTREQLGRQARRQAEKFSWDTAAEMILPILVNCRSI